MARRHARRDPAGAEGARCLLFAGWAAASERRCDGLARRIDYGLLALKTTLVEDGFDVRVGEMEIDAARAGLRAACSDSWNPRDD